MNYRYFLGITAIVMSLSASAIANADDFSDLDAIECPNARIEEDTAFCEVSDASAVLNAIRGSKLDTFPGELIGHIRSAVDLGLIPDDSTDQLYQHIRTLVDQNGRKVGFIVFTGYANSEMEARWKMSVKYGLSGKIVSIQFAQF